MKTSLREAGPGSALLSGTVEGYISQPNIVDHHGVIVAKVVSLRGTTGYGVLSRQYVRATTGGVLYSGSCALGETHLILRRVKS